MPYHNFYSRRLKRASRDWDRTAGEHPVSCALYNSRGLTHRYTEYENYGVMEASTQISGGIKPEKTVNEAVRVKPKCNGNSRKLEMQGM